jgi:hypothetical protein
MRKENPEKYAAMKEKRNASVRALRASRRAANPPKPSGRPRIHPPPMFGPKPVKLKLEPTPKPPPVPKPPREPKPVKEPKPLKAAKPPKAAKPRPVLTPKEKPKKETPMPTKLSTKISANLTTKRPRRKEQKTKPIKAPEVATVPPKSDPNAGRLPQGHKPRPSAYMSSHKVPFKAATGVSPKAVIEAVKSRGIKLEVRYEDVAGLETQQFAASGMLTVQEWEVLKRDRALSVALIEATNPLPGR